MGPDAIIVDSPTHNGSRNTIVTTEVTGDAPRRYTKSPLITIYVGQKRKEFTAHQDLLVAKSEYFKKCLTNDAREEAKTKKVYWDQEEDKVEAVDMMMDWLYNGKVRFRQEQPRQTGVMIDCYGLAHRKGMNDFKNDLMDTFREYQRVSVRFTSIYNVQKVRDAGIKDTPLHHFMFSTLVWTLSSFANDYMNKDSKIVSLRKGLRGVSQDLTADVTEALLKLQVEPIEDPRQAVRCVYHDHSDGSSCTVTA